MRNDNAPHIEVYYNTKKVNSKGEHPIWLKIYKDRKRAYKSLGLNCHPDQWDYQKNYPKRSNPNKAFIEQVIAEGKKVYFDKLNELTGEEQKRLSVNSLIASVDGDNSSNRRKSVFQFFEEVIERLVHSKAIGNANTYKDTFRSFKIFRKDKDLAFIELDYSMLVKYEIFMRKIGLADTSMSVYFRTLRALYNRAIKEGVAKLQSYPFNEFKISKFDTSTRKRAITKDDIKKLELLNLEQGSSIYEARQYFLFMYYGSGINFIDIALLKWNNVVGDRLYYVRAKTGKQINFKLLEPAQDILNYWKPLTGGNSANYIFQILSEERHITPIQINNRVHKVLGRVNKCLKELAQLASIEGPLTTYVARHTYATVLKRSGVSTSIISEAMGHKTEAITHTYLKSFENEILDEAAKNLL